MHVCQYIFLHIEQSICTNGNVFLYLKWGNFYVGLYLPYFFEQIELMFNGHYQVYYFAPCTKIFFSAHFSLAKTFFFS